MDPVSTIMAYEWLLKKEIQEKNEFKHRYHKLLHGNGAFNSQREKP